MSWFPQKEKTTSRESLAPFVRIGSIPPRFFPKWAIDYLRHGLSDGAQHHQRFQGRGIYKPHRRRRQDDGLDRRPGLAKRWPSPENGFDGEYVDPPPVEYSKSTKRLSLLKKDQPGEELVSASKPLCRTKGRTKKVQPGKPTWTQKCKSSESWSLITTYCNARCSHLCVEGWQTPKRWRAQWKGF